MRSSGVRAVRASCVIARTSVSPLAVAPTLASHPTPARPVVATMAATYNQRFAAFGTSQPAAASGGAVTSPSGIKKNKVHVLIGADGTRRFAFERNIPFAEAYESLARRMDDVIQWSLEDHPVGYSFQ